MKYILSIIALFLVSYSMVAQEQYDYIKNSDQVKNQRTIFTEIEINASPELVRKKFLEFEKWSEWCKVIPKIKVVSGDINNLETKPKLDLTLNFERKNDPAKAPANPILTVNSPEVLVWDCTVALF